MTLMRGDLNSIPDAIYMGKQTMANIKKNYDGVKLRIRCIKCIKTAAD